MRGARIFGITAVTVAGVAAAGFAALSTSSCGSTPPNVQVRSFQQARDVDYLCIAYNNPDGGGALSPTENVGLNPNLCSLVPPNGDGTDLPNHMLALVTQAARGEVAVVDLTTTPNGNLGAIVDESRVAPGTNFIPVGSQPTGIVVAPDAKMTFVASADTNKPAIYGIPTSAYTSTTPGSPPRTIGGVLGDSTQFPGVPVSPLTVLDLPACKLPQPPQTISVARMPASQGGPPAGYVIVATLQQAQGTPAAVVTIDPTGLLGGVGIGAAAGDAGEAGVGEAGLGGDDAGLGGLDGGDAGADAGSDGAAVAPPVTPGVLAACPILGKLQLADVTASGPVAWTAGPTWADGVPYADAGDLSSTEPSLGASCPAPSPNFTLPTTPSVQPYPGHAVMRDDAPLLYVADALLPEIHVIDVSDPAHPVEDPPLLATSTAQPTRQVTVGDIALSPVTREYQRFLYAIDQSDGTVMIFDVTDPVASPRTPLQRPHPELNPLSASDRLSFAAPVAALAFATHDWPIIPPGANGAANNDQVHAYSGLLCNPNPNVLVDGGAGTAGDGGVLDYGYFYTATQTGNVYANGTVQQIPLRLRGVFAFVTLSTGQVVTIDVDDWDAPCRRPDPMTIDPAHNYGMTGVLDIPEPDAGPPGSPTFLDPYAAPRGETAQTNQPSWVTQEAFFPVSAPHRMRSMFLLRNDPVVGNNAPNIVSPPSLTDVAGTTLSATVAGGVSALILPTALPDGSIDPSLVLDPTDNPASQRVEADASVVPGPTGVIPGVRLSFDDPTVSQTQVWTVTYEGALPTLNSITADILAPDADAGAGAGFQTLTLSIGQGLPGAGDGGLPLPGIGPGFCERGVEDWDLGQQRAQQALAEMNARGLPPPPDLKDWTGDYVEILDDPVQKGDPYWNVQNACWDGLRAGMTDLTPVSSPKDGKDPQPLADARYDACNQVFGTGSPDTFLSRDLPIIRAYDDHLDVGRFYWESDAGAGAPPVAEQTTNRKILGADPGNERALRFVACCFHDQATFKVRTGGEWVATGQGTGFLHHVVASSTPEADPLSGSAGSLRCVQSCNPQDVLLSSRSMDVPWAPIPWGTSSSRGDAGAGDPSDAGKGVADGGSDAGTVGLDCRFPAMAMPIDRNSALALRNPFLSYVTWMACTLPSSRFDHTVTLRDDAWHFQVGGGFSPLTASLTSNTLLDISPQSMRYIQPLGWMAIIDGQSQGLEIIDLNSPAIVSHSYF